MSRLREKYKKEVVPELIKKFNYKNIMAVPKLVKISINMGLGEGSRNPDLIDAGFEEMYLITGQKPVVAKAKRPISQFKLRKGMPIAVRVTLRREKMYEFLDRLINIALPRVRDFKGVNPRSFDGRGNYTLGLKDQIVFPEIDYGKVDRARGMNITIVTTAKTDEEGRELLRLLGMPFSRY